MNGRNQHIRNRNVRRDSHECVGEQSTGKLVAKARPRQTPNLTLSLVFFPYRRSSKFRRSGMSFLQRGGGIKKSFPYCVDPKSPDTFLDRRASQCHSGGALLIPHCKTTYYRQTTSSSTSAMLGMGTLTTCTLSSSVG